jgi:hypothetical protein
VGGRDFEDLALDPVQQLAHVLHGLEAAVRGALAGGDQPPQHGVLPDDVGVLVQVRRRGDRTAHLRQVRAPPGVLDPAGPGQGVRQRDHVELPADTLLGQAPDGTVDDLVLGPVENRLVRQTLEHHVHGGRGLQQNPPQHRHFRLVVVREMAVGEGGRASLVR